MAKAMHPEHITREHATYGFEPYGVEGPPVVMDDIDEDAPGRRYLRADRTQLLGITVDRPNGMQFPAIILSMKTPLLPFGTFDAMPLDDARRLVTDLTEAIDHMDKVMADMAAKGEAEWPLTPLKN